jgi:hypothetical protein
VGSSRKSSYKEIAERVCVKSQDKIMNEMTMAAYRRVGDELHAHAGALSLPSRDALDQRPAHQHVCALGQAEVVEHLVHQRHQGLLRCVGGQTHVGTEIEGFSRCGSRHQGIVLHHVGDVLAKLDWIDDLAANTNLFMKTKWSVST